MKTLRTCYLIHTEGRNEQHQHESICGQHVDVFTLSGASGITLLPPRCSQRHDCYLRLPVTRSLSRCLTHNLERQLLDADLGPNLPAGGPCREYHLYCKNICQKCLCIPSDQPGSFVFDRKSEGTTRPTCARWPVVPPWMYRPTGTPAEHAQLIDASIFDNL